MLPGDDEDWLETAPFPYYSPDDFSAGNSPRWSFNDTFGDGAESEEIAAMLIEHVREMSSEVGSAGCTLGVNARKAFYRLTAFSEIEENSSAIDLKLQIASRKMD